MLAGKGRLLVSRSRNSRGSFNCPHGAGHRLGPVGRCVDDSHSITFQILAERPGLPVSCTGWYAAPRGHAGYKVKAGGIDQCQSGAPLLSKRWCGFSGRITVPSKA